VKKNILLFGLLVGMSFGDAKINVNGNVTYMIDGVISNAKILKSGQTLTYTKGNGFINIVDNVNNNKRQISKKYNSPFTAMNKLSWIAKVFSFFVTSEVRTSSTVIRTIGDCEVIADNSEIKLAQDVVTIDYLRDDKIIAVYSVENNETNLSRGEEVSYTQNGDEMKLRNKNTSLLKSYCVKK